jgi:hypothetical protein
VLGPWTAWPALGRTLDGPWTDLGLTLDGAGTDGTVEGAALKGIGGTVTNSC